MKQKTKQIYYKDIVNHSITNRPLDLLLKPVGANCNLRCTYCYYLEKEKLYPCEKQVKMSDDILKLVMQKCIQELDTEIITFVWHGGEPMLFGIESFKKALEYQEKFNNNKIIFNSIQTNGILINDQWARFFAEHKFLVGVSIDGPEKLHNTYRINKDSKTSFKNVMKGVDYLIKYNVEFNTLSVINNITSQYPNEIYGFLKNIGSQFIQFIPAVERKSIKIENQRLVHNNYPFKALVTPWSVKPLDYSKFLCNIFDEWVKNDIGSYYVQIFDATLANYIEIECGLCIFSETCGTSCVIEKNGDVYSCDHFVYKDFYIGNIKEKTFKNILESPVQFYFGINKRNLLPNNCLICEFKNLCNGGCPKHRFLNKQNGNSGLNYLCAGYKEYFRHVSPYIKFMANEIKWGRSPSNAMLFGKENR